MCPKSNLSPGLYGQHETVPWRTHQFLGTSSKCAHQNHDFHRQCKSPSLAALIQHPPPPSLLTQKTMEHQTLSSSLASSKQSMLLYSHSSLYRFQPTDILMPNNNGHFTFLLLKLTEQFHFNDKQIVKPHSNFLPNRTYTSRKQK